MQKLASVLQLLVIQLFRLAVLYVPCVQLLQTASIMYIDTEKKFSSRRVVEMAKARWPQHFTSQVFNTPDVMMAPTCINIVVTVTVFSYNRS